MRTTKILTTVLLTGLIAGGLTTIAAPAEAATANSALRYYKLKRDLYITKANIATWGADHSKNSKVPARLAHHSSAYPGSVRITGTLKNYTVTAYNTKDKVGGDIKVVNGYTTHSSAGLGTH